MVCQVRVYHGPGGHFIALGSPTDADAFARFGAVVHIVAIALA